MTTNNDTWIYGGEPITAENARDIARELAGGARRAGNDAEGNACWYIWRGPFGEDKPRGDHWTVAQSCFVHGPGYYIQAETQAELTDDIYRAIVERLKEKGGEA